MKTKKTIHSRYYTPDVDSRNERLSNKEKDKLKESKQSKTGNKGFFKLF